MKNDLQSLQFHLKEIMRYLEGIETSAFPGLDCALMEAQVSQEIVENLLKVLEDQKDNK